jgi:membrane-associated phospholipid phosphatase
MQLTTSANRGSAHFPFGLLAQPVKPSACCTAVTGRGCLLPKHFSTASMPSRARPACRLGPHWGACLGLLLLVPTVHAARLPEQVLTPGPNDAIALPESEPLLQADAGTATAPSAENSRPLDAPVAPTKQVESWPLKVPYVGAWDFVAVSTLGVATVVLQVTYTPSTVPNWTGGVLADDWARRVLRLSSPSARAAAASVSDFLLYGLVALPFVDAWLGAGLTYGRPDVAFRLTLIDAEALLATTFVTLGSQHLTLRARPFVTLCVHQPTAGECTDGSAQDTSFPSGHTSIGFTVALLECVNHAQLDTDHSGWNGAACPVTLAAAGLTGLLRIASDRHYLSDVIVGGLLGAGIGFGVATLHFAIAPKNSTAAVIPVVAPGYAGLALAGGF